MSDQYELNPGERELEAALKSLTPVTMRLDPVAAAYRAGQRSAERTVRRWRLTAAAMALMGAGTWLLPRGNDLSAENHPRTPIAFAGSEMQPVSQQSMVMLRKALWQNGVDGLAPVQLGPIRIIHMDEINPTHKGEI